MGGMGDGKNFLVQRTLLSKALIPLSASGGIADGSLFGLSNSALGSMVGLTGELQERFMPGDLPGLMP